MLTWFKELDSTVPYGVVGLIVGALLKVLFKKVLFKKKPKATSHTIIKQKVGHNNKGDVIGIQNNTTITLGDTDIDNGTLVIDGGTAIGSGCIKVEKQVN